MARHGPLYPSPFHRLHVAFLVAGVSEGGSRESLGAFLVLRLVDALCVGQRNTEGMAYQVAATEEFLAEGTMPGAQRAPDDPTAFLSGVLEAAGHVVEGGSAELLATRLEAFAEWLAKRRRLAQALDVLDTTTDLVGARGLPGAPRLWLARCPVLRRMGRIADAQWMCCEGRRAARAEGETRMRLLCDVEWAGLDARAGRHERACRRLGALLRVAERLGEIAVAAQAHHRLARILLRQGRFAEARAHGLEAAGRYRDVSDVIRALADAATAARRLGALDEAASILTDALQRPGISPAVEREATLRLGRVAAARGDRLGFERCRQRVEALCDPHDGRASGLAWARIGLDYAVLGAWSQANDYCERALRAVPERGRARRRAERAAAAVRRSRPAAGGGPPAGA